MPELWTDKFGKDGMGYIKMMSNPNRYITEQSGQKWTSVEPDKNKLTYEDLPQTAEDWMDYSSGDITPVIESQQARERREDVYGLNNSLQTLGISNAPIVKMGSDPEINGMEIGENPFNRMSNRERRRTNRQLNRDQRQLNRDVRKDARVEQAIIDKYGSNYNAENRASIKGRFGQEQQRIDLMRRLLNG